MEEQNNGWYWTWFYDPKKFREKPDCEIGFDSKVFSPFFVHKEKDSLEKILEDLASNEDENIKAKRNVQLEIMNWETQYEGKLDEQGSKACNQAARDKIKEIEDEIKVFEEWKKQWRFLHPSQKHWMHKGESGKEYNLVVRRYMDPLTINVSGTMACSDHFVDIEVLPGLHFKINATAYSIFTRQIERIKETKSSYAEIRTHPSYYNLFPPKVVESLIKHPWEQYKDKMDYWMEERKFRLMTL